MPTDGLSADYDNNVERRGTHLLLMPRIESGRILAADDKILEKIVIVMSARPPAKKAKKGTLQGNQGKSILPGVGRRQNKYAP